MISNGASIKTRFDALDAWRGLCACLVAMFHVQAYSHLYGIPFIRHSYLFVDFFFVLSGFVITANYRDRLLSGFPFWKFMLLRFGRVYPLHLAMLLAFIALEAARYNFHGLFGGDGGVFSGQRSYDAIVSNLLLVQALDLHETLTWNFPSWSISVEFYTYVVFAVALLVMRRYIYCFIATVCALAPVFLVMVVGHIDTQFDYGIVRCLFGFAIGFACYDLHRWLAKRVSLRTEASFVNAAELTCVGVVLAFVSLCDGGALSVSAPALFGCVVLVFSLEGGCVSRILGSGAFRTLGMLSYSIYMVHVFVLLILEYAARASERAFGLPILTRSQLGTTLWLGDVWYGVALCAIVGLSYVTYELIEEPGRRYSRRIAERLFGARVQPVYVYAAGSAAIGSEETLIKARGE